MDGLSEGDRRRWQEMESYNDGYLQIQSKSPQTLAYALHDSPAGQLAWIAEMYERLTDGGTEDAIVRDRLLTEVSLYWLTGTAGSSAQMYYEAMNPNAWATADASEWDSGDGAANEWESSDGAANEWDSGDADNGGWSGPERGTVPTGYLVSTQDVTIRAFAERDYNVVH